MEGTRYEGQACVDHRPRNRSSRLVSALAVELERY